MLQIDKQQKEIANLKKNLAKKTKENQKLVNQYESLSKQHKNLVINNEITQRQLNRAKEKNKKRNESQYIYQIFSNKTENNDSESE